MAALGSEPAVRNDPLSTLNVPDIVVFDPLPARERATFDPVR